MPSYKCSDCGEHIPDGEDVLLTGRPNHPEWVIITDRQTVIECFDKAGDPVAMWCILRAKAPKWHPWCFVKAGSNAVHDRECGAYQSGEECDRCPYSESDEE